LRFAQVPIHATVVESEALPAAGACLDEQGQVEVVEQIAKVISPSLPAENALRTRPNFPLLACSRLAGCS